jgi:hypothetical protein
VLAAHLNGRHLWIGSKFVAVGTVHAARGTVWGLRGAGRTLGKLHRPRAARRLHLAPVDDEASGRGIATSDVEASPGPAVGGRRKRSKVPEPPHEQPLEPDPDPEEPEPQAVVVGGMWALPTMD